MIRCYPEWLREIILLVILNGNLTQWIQLQVCYVGLVLAALLVVSGVQPQMAMCPLPTAPAPSSEDRGAK